VIAGLDETVPPFISQIALLPVEVLRQRISDFPSLLKSVLGVANTLFVETNKKVLPKKNKLIVFVVKILTNDLLVSMTPLHFLETS
jgi:hypothetical protein